MYGAIIGDILGSSKEQFELSKELKKQRFTDDSVLTIATAQKLMDDSLTYEHTYQTFYRLYPDRGFGTMFIEWANSFNLQPYNSFGNGGAMRVSPIAYIANSIDEVLIEAKISASCTHNHPDGIRGSQAIALAIFLARTNHSKLEIKELITSLLKYDLNKQYSDLEINKTTAIESSTNALICFLESTSFLDSINKVTALGGDTDTIGAMTGAISEAFYKNNLAVEYKDLLENTLDDFLLGIIRDFYTLYKEN